MKTLSDQVSGNKPASLLRGFLFMFLPLVLFFGSLTLLQYIKDVKSQQSTLEQAEKFNISSQLKFVGSRFSPIITDLKYLSVKDSLNHYLLDGSLANRTTLAQDLRAFSEIKSIYSHIKILDKTGHEVVSIINSDERANIVPHEKLLSQAGRNYFNQTKKLSAQEVYVSPFDLNTNQNEEAEAVRSIIRFSMRVDDSNGTMQGMIVLNYKGSSLIEDLEIAASHSSGINLLVTSNGFFLNAPHRHKEWTSSFPDQQSGNIESFLPDEWKQIQEKESGQFKTPKGLITFSTIYPVQAGIENTHNIKAGTIRTHHKDYLWKTISFIPETVMKAWPEKILGRIFLIYSVIVIIVAISSILIARTSLKRKLAEEALRESEEELRAINEAAANAIIVIDNNKNVLHWNPAAEKLFQYTTEEVMEKPVTSIISPPTHQSTFTKISKRFKLPEQGSMEAKTIELFGYKKDGTEFPVEVSFSAFKSRDQWHTVGIIRDISARKNMENEVLRAQKFESLGALSSGIANDFNNLLTAIIGNLNLMGKISGPPQENLALLDNAEKAARQAKALSQQLLTFSKGGNPVRKPTSIKPIIHEAVEFALYGSSIPCNLQIDEDLWLVDVDRAQIGQIIQNLTLNARQALSGSGTIDIWCKNVTDAKNSQLPSYLTGNYIEFVITDSGRGIPKNHQAKIFEPYFTTKEHGSGLGLTIVCSIIQKHDGYIVVSSEIDKGSTFTFYLPAAVDQHVINGEYSDSSPKKQYKILVVDNETMLLNIAEQILVHLGHECLCAKNALEALAIYKDHWKMGSPVDGVIMDLTLPEDGMGGKEVAGALFDINSEARIIVSSGYSNDQVMVDFDEYGFCAAIAKPFDMNELSEVINTVLA